MLAADTISSTRATWWNRTSGSAPLRTIVFAYYMHAISVGMDLARTRREILSSVSLERDLRKYVIRESNKIEIFNLMLREYSMGISFIT